MRRTARALSLAAVAGTFLGVLVPAASAGTAPGSGPSWGTASHSPCPEPGGHVGEHAWEGHTSESTAPGKSTAPGAAQPEASKSGAWEPDSLEPDSSEPGASEPDSLESDALELETLETETLEEEVLEPDAALPEGTALDELVPDAVPEEDAGIPAPAGSEADDSKALDYKAKESKPAEPTTTVPPKPVKPKPVEPKPTATKPTATKSTHCTPTPTTHPTHPTDPTHPTPPAHHGVHAGGGGAFTDSVPALAAGGLLIAGAFGAAAHRLYRDRTPRRDA
ncbi:hypothetical protein ABZ759_24555 [Streptomyces sp. NPDC047860]|uniref:hypothetical protein n=1 Tax=Streptomyces sp. NPDC047860 TaxID=3155743 RepID=UPI0033C9A211